MKKIIIEEQGEGLEKLLGQRVTFFCCRYIYTGMLKGVNDDSVLLTDCGIVYETGALDKKDWDDYLIFTTSSLYLCSFFHYF